MGSQSTSPIDRHRAELVAACTSYGVKRLELFGSAAGDHFDPQTSDLDFLVEFGHMSSAEHARCYFGLLDALQSLFGRRIDLVEVTAVENPFFLASISSSRELVYAA